MARADERQARDEVYEQVTPLFAARNFEALEQIVESYRTSFERTPAGMLKLRLFYGGIEKTISVDGTDDPVWAESFNTVDEWVAAYPDSPTPHIAKADLLMRLGWAHRGGGFARTVDPYDMQLLKQIAAEAREYLLDHRDVASRDPEYYSTLADADLALATPEAAYRENLDEGLDRFANYDELYFRATQYYVPKWHGSEQDLAFLAAEAVNRTKESRGFELYARIYWAAGRGTDGGYFFQRPPANWELMRTGILDLVERYPDQWNINHLAFFACLNRDYELAATLIDLLEEPILESAWYRRSNLELCRRKISQPQ